MANQAVAPQRDSTGSWLGALASLIVGAGFLALWFWLLPPWLGFHREVSGLALWHWLGVIPAALGFAVMLRCI